MNDKTIAELREWDKKHCDGQLCFESRDVFEKILSRAEQEAKDEPLAVMADRKGAYIGPQWNGIDKYFSVRKEWFIEVIKESGEWTEICHAETYAAAESKARAYLAELPDKEEGK